jgi:peptidoglycan hydrolase-like protein with peptidoglycan-binding domain
MSNRDLEWEMSGPDVKAIQEALDLQPGLKSPRLDHNGIFGPKTDAKVREFQALKHIKVTDRVGAALCSRLGSLPSPSSEPNGLR